MKSTLIVAALIFSLSAFAESLRFETLGYTAETSWSVAPEISQEAVMNLIVRDEQGNAVNAGIPYVELYMPEMDHGSVPASLEKVPGGYTVKNLWFLMSGIWEVRLTLKRNGESETQIFNVTL